MNTAVLTPTKTKTPPWRTVGFCALIGIAFSFMSTLITEEEGYGALSLLPSLLIVITAIVSKRPLESILSGVVAGLLLLDPGSAITSLGDIATSVMMNETIAWIILVCGMMGGLITMLEKGGSVLAFSGMLVNRLKSKRQTLMGTSLLGLAVFIDDYLNSLAVSTSMKNLTDRYRISREKLAFVVDSTAAPVCILVPVSTWAVYFAALLEENNATAEGNGMMLYIESIPYMAYGWAALLIVWLVVMGWLPDIGPMKKAEKRAQAGQPIPDNAPAQELDTSSLPKTSPTMGLLNFLLPMAVLVGASLYYEIDLLLGALVASVFTMVLYYWQRLMAFSELVECMLSGFKVMLHPIAMVAAGFMLKEINDQLGMTPYIIDTITPYLNKALLPAVVFAVMAAVVFATGSSWGVFVISLPVVIPLAQGMDMSMPLTIGALLSASAFGSHACFFSDATVLSAQGSGCGTMDHAVTQIPYALIGGAVAIVSLLIMGFALA